MAVLTKDCEHCGNPFEAARATAKYCSTNCRVKSAAKKTEVTIVSQGEVTETTDSFLPDDELEEKIRHAPEAHTIRRESTPQSDENPFPDLLADAKPDGTIPADISLEKKPAKRKKRVAEQTPNIEIPPSMADRMAEIRERQNARLRAKGLPLVSNEPEVLRFVPTGIGELDALTAELDADGSGGLPRKRITEIYGPKGAGKTSLVKTILKMNPETRVLFFDAEGGMVAPPANMNVVKGNVVEEIMPNLIDAVISQDYDLIIVDSIASLVTQKQFDDEAEGIAPMARMFGPYVKKLVAHLQPLKDGLPDPTPGTAVVFINQFRSTTQSFGVKEYTVGGKSMEYYASLRLEFRSASKDHIIRNGKLAGQHVRVKVEKTRFGTKLEEFRFAIMYDELKDFNEHYMTRMRELGIKK